MSRVDYSIKNVKYSVFFQIISILFSLFARMIFIEQLGVEFLGLNGLFSNVLSLLSFADLGVGTAITYSLYKPIAENNNEKISILLNFYKKTYINIGIFSIFLGIIIFPILPYFIDDYNSYSQIGIYYFLVVLNTAISYFFSYRRTIIIAYQKKYIETIIHNVMFLIMTLIQILLLLIYRNYLFYLLSVTFSTLIENIWISKKSKELFPYFRNVSDKNLDDSTRGVIVKNTVAMMGHKIGAIVVNGTDNLLISRFVGIISVGIYSNYFLITRALNTLYRSIFMSLTASIGNLAVIGTDSAKQRVFYTLNFIGFWVFGFSFIALYFLMNPFISLWIGDEFVFNSWIVFLIAFNFYISGMRNSVLTFRDAYGLYWNDRYKPFIEAIINIIASIILANYIGIAGIFLGTTISTLTICFWVEPKILFKYGLMDKVSKYFIKYIYYSLVMFFTTIVIEILFHIIKLNDGFISFLIRTIIVIILSNTIFLILFIKKVEFKDAFSILLRFARKIIK
jgi:O-antigen/teichoic acid export membrane protein